MGCPDPSGIRRKAVAAVRHVPQAPGDATCAGRWMISGCARQGSKRYLGTPVLPLFGATCPWHQTLEHPWVPVPMSCASDPHPCFAAAPLTCISLLWR